MESVQFLWAQRREARNRDGAEQHDPIQSGDVFQARIHRQNHAVANADAAITQACSKRTGTFHRVGKRPRHLACRRAVGEKYVSQSLR